MAIDVEDGESLSLRLSEIAAASAVEAFRLARDEREAVAGLGQAIRAIAVSHGMSVDVICAAILGHAPKPEAV